MLVGEKMLLGLFLAGWLFVMRGSSLSVYARVVGIFRAGGGGVMLGS